MLNTGASFNSGCPLLGILGGLGPMAGVKLHEKVIQYSKKHLELVHLDTPVADRVRFLEGGCKCTNPGDDMFTVVNGLSALAKARRKYVIAGVPCNTFHLPQMWEKFCSKTRSMNEQIAKDWGEPSSDILPGQVHLVHAVRETVEYCKGLGVSKIGLLSITAARKAGVYFDDLKAAGIDLIQVDTKCQSQVHDSIFNPDWGIKSINRGCQRSRGILESSIRQLKQEGASAVILGCSELPIVLTDKELEGVTLIDPMDVLARRLLLGVGELCESQKKFMNYDIQQYDDLI